ncbi:MAG: hypothetical protein JSS35_17860 [Proteobacteria bacterium]|nr:hypothetical protein [Pseudomonadota bacterium]
MRSRWALIGVALAVAPAYAAFVYGYKLAEFLGFAVRLDQGLPPMVWGQVALTALQMVVIAGALATCWQFASLGRRRAAAVAMAVAWLAAAPLYVLLIFARPV